MVKAKFDSFNVSISIEIQFFRLSFTIEPSLFTADHYNELFENIEFCIFDRGKITDACYFNFFPRDDRIDPVVLEYRKKANSN